MTVSDCDCRSREFPPIIYALGFSGWKKGFIRRFIPESVVVFVSDGTVIPAGGTILLWGSAEKPQHLSEEASAIRVEDGFLRSVGLGADLIQPISFVFDRQGIYYDAARPSDLELCLASATFSPGLIARATRLVDSVVSAGLTKYNVGRFTWSRPPHAKRIILVPGQVESDASIRLGAPGVKSNIDLLRSVRERNPDAYVVYKPHPDVLAGLRAPGQGEEGVSQYCDEVARDVGMGNLLSSVDEVHVLTSLAGFEALMRRKSVTCYGQPFYSGWGLTEDINPLNRRHRNLALAELVAGALIRYPRYLSLRTGTLCTPEQALEELQAWRERSPHRVTLWRKAFRMILRRVVGVR